MSTRYKADVTVLPAVPHNLATFIKAGIRKVYLFDYDGVMSPYRMNGTLPRGYYTPNKFRRVPNPLYTPEESLKKNRYDREPRSFDDAYSTLLMEDLKPLFADPSSLLVMVTTWRANAPIDEFNFGAANPIYYLPWGYGDTDMTHSNKVGAVAEFISDSWGDTPVKLTWVDDIVLSDSKSIRHDDDPVSVSDYMFRHFSDPSTDVKLVAPSSSFALSKDEVSDIKNFML